MIQYHLFTICKDIIWQSVSAVAEMILHFYNTLPFYTSKLKICDLQHENQEALFSFLFSNISSTCSTHSFTNASFSFALIKADDDSLLSVSTGTSLTFS